MRGATCPGGPGGLRLKSRRRATVLVIAVKDNGAGIPAAALPRIFERFYRVDAARSREEGGTGLGLAIVRHLVSSMGGNVAAESIWGSGTTITFTVSAWWGRECGGRCHVTVLSYSGMGRFFHAAWVGLVLCLAGCRDEPGDAGTLVVVDGSSSLYALSEAVAELFHGAFPQYRVVVRVSGSGGGLRRFCEGRGRHRRGISHDDLRRERPGAGRPDATTWPSPSRETASPS